MTAALDKALDLILASEGAEVNRSASEPGGISKYGVSLTAYNDLRKRQGLPPAVAKAIADLTEDAARAFYAEAFAKPLRFDELPMGPGYRALDIEANLGPTGGINALEIVLGRWPLLGKVDDELIAKAKAVDPLQLIVALGSYWIGLKHTSPNWPKYGHGWTRRMNIANDAALKMVGGR